MYEYVVYIHEYMNIYMNISVWNHTRYEDTCMYEKNMEEDLKVCTWNCEQCFYDWEKE